MAASGADLDLCGMRQVFGVSAPANQPWRILHNPGDRVKESHLTAKNPEKVLSQKPQIIVLQMPLNHTKTIHTALLTGRIPLRYN
jgi:hypothetical protein